jgi:poly(3-hydroxybutyrate) depolymerase
VTVSGLSSGGFFAHQFHIAYSALVGGAGIAAGGPYACAEQAPFWLRYYPNQALTYGLTVCSHIWREKSWLALWLPSTPDPNASLAAIRRQHAKGVVDDPANLGRARVWLWAGGKDNVVPGTTVRMLKRLYELLDVSHTQISLVEEQRANHGLPIEQYAGAGSAPTCEVLAAPYLIDCDYDAAKLLFAHLYPENFSSTPALTDRDRLIRFDQTSFTVGNESKSSMDREGYVYVPTHCANGTNTQIRCKLHVAFHGCGQSVEIVQDAFYWHGGYNRWAEANNVVVLFPQVAMRDFNPEGCWDWWGYTGSEYLTRNGMQMRAVKGMIDRMLRN